MNLRLHSVVHPSQLTQPPSCSGSSWTGDLPSVPHVAEVNSRAKSRLNVLRALSSTAFGHTRESQSALYKQFVRPVLSYASMAWAPHLAKTHLDSLRRTQNAALRIANGCVRSTTIPHLHAESLVLPIGDHMDMRGTQFFAAAAQPEHPCNHLHHPLATRRHLRQTPASYYGSLRDLVPPSPQRRSERSLLHEHFVTCSLAAAPSNLVLGALPPPISPDETRLSRLDRVHLARLRCGHHPAFRSYEVRLRPDTDPACRWCRGPSETVPHLFEGCTALAGARRRTGVTSSRDLWDHPAAAVDFLRSAGILQ